MQVALNCILIVAMSIGFLLSSKKALHMFQQNRYELGRYTTWLKENIVMNMKDNLFVTVVMTLIFAVGILWQNVVLTTIVCVLVFVFDYMQYFITSHTSYIKPLVYTGRVKRQIAVLVILYVLWMFILYHFELLVSFSLVTCYCVAWILIYLVGLITSPIEAAVRKSYLNDAKRILEQHQGLIKIGITGSFGKTTTKNIMQAMMSEEYNSLMTPASYNTPMGITRTIREMLRPIHQVFVCEMGADHVGDIQELMDFVHPNIGVVTSIGPQHLNTFGSLDNIIKEKMKMIEMLPQDGFGILNYDNEYIRNYSLKNKVETVTYGVQHTDVDFYAKDIVYGQTGTVFTIVNHEDEVRVETKLLGELNVLNILSATACARHLGISWQTISKAIKQMKQVEHRLELKKINGYTFIDDAFNANPVGSAMALEVLSMMPNTRYIVTPGMIDLGEKQYEINKNFGKLMLNKADFVILVGKNQTKPIKEGLLEVGYPEDKILVVDHVSEAFHYVYSNATRVDTILLENDLPDAFNH